MATDSLQATIIALVEHCNVLLLISLLTHLPTYKSFPTQASMNFFFFFTYFWNYFRLTEICKVSIKELLNALPPNFQEVTFIIAYHSLSPHTFFSETFATSHLFTPKNFHSGFLNTRIFSYINSTVIKIRKLTLIQFYYLIYRPYSNFTIVPITKWSVKE